MKNFIATAAIAAGLLVAGSASASANLIVNGDFEGAMGDPNTAAGRGFDTDYAHRTGLDNQPGHVNGMWDEGTWTVGTNPHDVHALWIDQTFSNMLILNGLTHDLPSVAWSQEFTVAGGVYDYAFDVVNLYRGPGASHIKFEFSGNGGSFQELSNVVTQADGSDAGVIWHRSGQFSTGAGSLRVSLRNYDGAFGGNDFGIDNISISQAAVPEPTSWALMLMGFAGMGAMLRADRRRTVAATA